MIRVPATIAMSSGLPSMDDSVLQTIADRLEFRGRMTATSAVTGLFRGRLGSSARRILAVGCGTGIEVRALSRATQPGVAIVGVDHSSLLIDTARRLTAEEGSMTTSPTRLETHINFSSPTVTSIWSRCTPSSVTSMIRCGCSRRRVGWSARVGRWPCSTGTMRR